MHSFTLRGIVAGLTVALLFATAGSADAVTLNWDPTLSDGAALGGTGMWDDGMTNNWWDAAQTVWISGADANFGGTLSGPATVTVDAAGIASVNALTLGGTGGNYTLGGTGTITLTGVGGNATVNTDATISAPIGGTVGLTKLGTSALVLSGTNTYAGATAVSAGILSLGNSLALRNSELDTTNSIAGDATNGLRTTVTTLTLGGLTGNKNLASVFTTSAGGYDAVTALTLNPGTGVSNSYSGVIADGAAGMTLTKTGAGTQSLSGANSFTGQLTVQTGTLAIDTINDAGANGTLGNSALPVVLGRTGSQTGTLQYTGATAASTKPFTLATGGTGAFQVDNSATNLTLSGAIDGGGKLSKTGPGTLTLAAANTFSGATTIGTGILSLGHGLALQNSALDTAASVFGDANNGLQTTVTTLTLGGLTGSADLASVFTTTSGGYGAVTALTLNPGTGVSNTYAGAIADGAAGMTLAKTGAGTQILSGANTYSGNTAINAGTLQFTSAAAIGGTGRSVNVASGATVAVGYAVDNAFLNRLVENSNAFDIKLTVTSANDLDFSSSTGANLPNAVLAGAGNISYTGVLTPNGTTYRLAALDTNVGFSNARKFNVGSATVGLTGAGNSLVVSGTQMVDLTANTAATTSMTYGGSTTVKSGAALHLQRCDLTKIGGGSGRNILVEDGASLLRNGGALDNSLLQRLVENSNAFTIYGSNGSSGANLDLSGTAGGAYLPNVSLALYDSVGTQTFTFTGTITPADNTYRFGGPRAGNNINLTIANTLTGARSVVVNGGNLRLAASMDYTGDTTINAGTFTIGSPVAGFPTAGNGQIGGGNYAGNILNNGTLAHTSSLNQILSGVISGTGAVTKSFTTSTGGNAGTWGTTSTLTLTGTNTYSGVTSVQAGTLAIGADAPSGAPGALGNATSDVNLGVAGGNNNASILIGGPFTVGRNIRLLTSNNFDAGTRVLTLGGNTADASTFSGNVFLGTTNQAGFGLTLTAAAGGQVTFSGVLQDPSGMDATTYSVTKAGEGAVVFSGANTYTGATAVNAGTLTLDYSANNSSKINDAAVLTLGGGTLNLSGGTHTEVVGSTTLTPATASRVTGTPGASALQMGYIAGGGYTYASVDFGASGIATADNSNFDGVILGTWATVGGADWATNSTNASNGPVTAYAGYADVNRRNGGTQVIADGATHVRLVEGTTGSPANITLGGATTTTISTLNQSAVGGATAATIDPAAGQTLRVNAILVGTGAGGLTIGAATNDGTLETAAYGGELLLINNSTSGLTVNAVLAENSYSLLTKRGTGTATLAGANNFAGGTTILAGTLQLAHAAALGTGTLTFLGGDLDSVLPNLVNTNNNPQAWNADFTFVGTQNLDLGTGSVMLNANRQVTVAANTLTVGGGVDGAFNLTKAGPGTLVLAGANSYAGTTTVLAGQLTLSNWSGNTLGAVTVAGTPGAILEISGSAIYSLGANSMFLGTASGNSGTVNQTGGTVTYASGNALLIGNGSGGSSGTYNLSGGTLSSYTSTTRGVILGVNPGNSATFNLSGTGDLSLSNAILQIGRSDAAAANCVALFNQTGGTATVATLAIGGTGTGNTAATMSLTAGTFAATNFSKLATAANDVVAINIGGTAEVTLPKFPTVRGAGATATVTFDGGTLKPAAASTTYMGGLTNAFIKTGGAKFDTVNGSITITQNLLTDPLSTGGGLTKNGINALTLTGANTYTGPTVVSAGVLSLGNALAMQNSPLDTLNSVVGDAGNGLQTTMTTLTMGGLTGNKDLASVFTTTSGGYGAVTALTLNPGSAVTHSYSGVIADGAAGMGLTKTGLGTQVLSGANAYTGNTNVNAGVLQIDQGLAANPAASTTVGTTGAGATTATLITAHVRQGTLTINADSKVTINGAGTSVVNFLQISDGADFTWGAGGGIAPAGASAAGGVSAVPEPSAWVLLGLGLLSWLVYRRRR